jgi:hypothetical protein
MFRIRIHLVRIRIQHFRLNSEYRSGSGSRVLMTKNWKKFTAEIFFIYFVDQKLQFTYPDVQATGEAFSSQKRTSSTSKHKISSFCSIFVGHFLPSWIWI